MAFNFIPKVFHPQSFGLRLFRAADGAARCLATAAVCVAFDDRAIDALASNCVTRLATLKESACSGLARGKFSKKACEFFPLYFFQFTAFPKNTQYSNNDIELQ